VYTPAKMSVARFRRPPTSTLLPYTTLFRSEPCRRHGPAAAQHRASACIYCRRHGRRGELRRDELHHDRRADRHDRLRAYGRRLRSEEHTSELQSRENLVCRLLLEKEKFEYR